MQFFHNLPDIVKGILLIVGGFILLFDTLGIATEILHTIVLLGAIAMILFGIYLSNAHMMIYKLLTKENKKNNDESDQPPQ